MYFGSIIFGREFVLISCSLYESNYTKYVPWIATFCYHLGTGSTWCILRTFWSICCRNWKKDIPCPNLTTSLFLCTRKNATLRSFFYSLTPASGSYRFPRKGPVYLPFHSARKWARGRKTWKIWTTYLPILRHQYDELVLQFGYSRHLRLIPDFERTTYMHTVHEMMLVSK